MLTKTQIAIKTGRTLFPNKVKNVADGLGKTENVIKKSTNKKLGKRVTKGKFTGMPMFTVTLEERATCSTSCVHYKTCYGNSMPFATIYEANTALIDRMEIELKILNVKYPMGFLVRLHVLGDFYSINYVNKWNTWLKTFENLHVYGYSEKKDNDPIGIKLNKVRAKYGRRFMVRVSGDVKRSTMSALSYDDIRTRDQIKNKQAFICPVQLDQTDTCSTCSLCWTTQKNVIFLTH
jgi:hypothetical protein